MAPNSEKNILIFDIEGNDSVQRGEQRNVNFTLKLYKTFEQTTSLFALAIADVLLINIWTNVILILFNGVGYWQVWSLKSRPPQSHI